MPFGLRGSVAAGALLVGACTLGTLTGCGNQPSEELGQVDASIVGGKLDTTHKGVVALLKELPGSYYTTCSGTLLTQNLVLTAHHCVAALNAADGEKVDCAKTTFQDTQRASSMLISIEDDVGTDKSQHYKVSDLWVPIQGGAVCGTDVALLLLSGSGVPATAATPIAPGLTKPLAVNEVFAAIGYGLQDPNDTTGKTVGHRMSVLDAKVFCEGAGCGTDTIVNGEFGADSPTCSGDSGGPALDAAGQVSGVTSRGDDQCAHATYSSVYAWGDFIRAKALVAAQSGHYTPPDWATAPPTQVEPAGGTNSGGTSNGGASSAGTSNTGGVPTGSGSTVVGEPTAAGGAADGGSPAVDTLGLSCTGQCAGAYKCWAETGKPPGICVPQCSATQSTCPTNYTCDTGLGACIKASTTTTTTTPHSSSCSAAVAGANTSTNAHAEWWFALGLFGFVSLGRRAKRRANGI